MLRNIIHDEPDRDVPVKRVELAIGEIGADIEGELVNRSDQGLTLRNKFTRSTIGIGSLASDMVPPATLGQTIDKRWNVGVVFKRAEGAGTIRRIEGLDGLLARYGEHIVHVDLVPVGSPRRDYRQVVEGDGWIVVRHPDLETVVDMSNHVATDLRMVAG